jgi:type IV secretory pathway TraG/TraD family ATPase VirD4
MLFIPYRAGQIAALRSMIATWMHLAIFEAMSQSLHADQRLWFVVDELDALGSIDGLKDALARLRKFGCRCVLGFQSIAQVSSTYGLGEAQTLVENCGNTLILRCAGSENGGTSQFASRLIGDREVLRRQLSRGSDRESSLSSRGARRSRSSTVQHVTETAVMASELEQLPDLCGYLKCASSAVWLKVAFVNHYSRGGPRGCP